ncbi:MAG: IS4 family transposase, partial [Bacteroidales bacterium]|nr:IS4 family transposase [Bacteroidales bacterium]
ANLAKTNANRDYHIFEEFAKKLIDIAQNKRINTPFELYGKFFAFDVTGTDKYNKNGNQGGSSSHLVID